MSSARDQVCRLDIGGSRDESMLLHQHRLHHVEQYGEHQLALHDMDGPTMRHELMHSGLSRSDLLYLIFLLYLSWWIFAQKKNRDNCVLEQLKTKIFTRKMCGLQFNVLAEWCYCFAILFPLTSPLVNKIDIAN